ncbi:hypothetical protein LWI28_011439 [Acer negundo]|uniref:Uncharacterized protein n=1 Tax=Acer negundo TaxID=4023 RepID=A0AAD5IM58_ACENE|nr:hypothetical protein LWI28_011439 [Acer negundo]
MNRFKKSSKLNYQGVVADSDIDEHRANQMSFSLGDPCAFNYETNVVTSAALDEYRKYYDITDSVELILHEKFHRDLSSTPVFAYGVSKHTATVPGPTIKAVHGIDTYVTWKNHLPSKHKLPWDPTIPTAIPFTKKGIPIVVHLHGGINEPESNGHPKSWFHSWIHHAMCLTRVNLVASMIGSCIIRHHDVEAPFGLPSMMSSIDC